LLFEQSVLLPGVFKGGLSVAQTGGPAVGISVGLELDDDVEDLFADGAEIEQIAPVLQLLQLLDGDGVVSVLLAQDAADKDVLVIRP
jgi:non-canonical (house-cleaning) NTP pyrophosphatase